jgi:uncharacterized protein YfaT (DUF1175 family)
LRSFSNRDFIVRHELNSRSPVFLSVAFLISLIAGSLALSRLGRGVPASTAQPSHISPSTAHPETWTDRWGDGFPDAVRLDAKQDRENFVRWVTFLAEAQFYDPAPAAQDEIEDCSALVRFAFRNALVSHTAAWRRSMGLPFDPGFEDVGKFYYPDWPLGRGLFRVEPGPLEPEDRHGGVFAEFADSAALLHYNSFFISRQVSGAQPGDLLFFYQPGQQQPYHTMVFVGRSHFQSHGLQWIVYHTGDLNGHRGEIREVETTLLMQHPDPRWRPAEANPRFLGVYRFDILR